MDAIMDATISDKEFNLFKDLIYRIAGISLSPAKKALVCGRLGKRLNQYRIKSYAEYFNMLTSREHQDELQIAVDLLTTNETYFFREPKHFSFLREKILPARQPGQPFRVWSAACSTGEEAYSIAMVLAEGIGLHSWEVLASDLSSRVLGKARSALYSMNSHKGGMPREYLQRFCLRGIGSAEGQLAIAAPIRERVSFAQINLNEPLPSIGQFDLIFLRNVLIYFDKDTKRNAVTRLLQVLRPGGHLFVGHSESLNGIVDEQLVAITPAIYLKP